MHDPTNRLPRSGPTSRAVASAAPRSGRLPSRFAIVPAVLGALAIGGVLSAPTPAGAQAADYASVVTADARTERGLFDVHRVDGRLLFEVPDSLLGRDMAVMSRYARAQEGLASGGDRMAPNMVVRWERREDRIVLRAVSHSSTADEGTPVHLAVENSNFAPVIAAFAVEARGGDGAGADAAGGSAGGGSPGAGGATRAGDDATGAGASGPSSVIDVTDLYLGDHPAFSLPRNRRTQLQVQGQDRDRSWLEWTRSFPINVEVRVVRTYRAGQPPSNARGGAVSFEVNHSMVLLPEEPMMPRFADERVGIGSIARTNYSSGFQGVRPERYVRRYRLEPSDPEAFARGEPVEPVEPWVWLIDPATPEEWVPYVEAGLLEWNQAFEEAGFRNAVQVRVAPPDSEDADVTLLDARVSVVRWVTTTTRSANAGGDVVDPRSGEVIRAHMNMYEGILERLRWLLLSQVATANPQFQTNEIPLEDMGEAIRYVVSHEMAHAVGLPHNQRANFVFPVDSLRDPGFIERMGHSGSSVGRTRYNYVAQPGDGVNPERRIGLWDRFAVMWGYRPIPGADTPYDELDTLNEWVVERADRPWFRFGSAQFGMDAEWDPYRMTEGISDDPVRAAEYGMMNLRTATENLMDWVLSPGDDYYELETHYLQNLTQWNRYAEHAAAAIGGSWTHHKRYGEEGWVYTPIEREYQLAAMRFLDEHVLATPHWALDLDLLRRLEHAGAVERIRAYQELAVQRFLNHARLARMIEHETFLGEETYRPAEMLDDVREIVWREVGDGAVIDTFRRNLQRAYLQQVHHLLHDAESNHWSPPSSGNLRVSSNNDPPLRADLHIAQSDIRPLLREQLRLLEGEIRARLDAGVDHRSTRIHLEDALERIGAAL